MAGGRLFHARDAATGKAPSPRVDRCTDGTTSVMEVATSLHIGCPTNALSKIWRHFSIDLPKMPPITT